MFNLTDPTRKHGATGKDLGGAEIRDENMPIAVQQNVFRFQVSVNDALHVHVFDRMDQFGRVESSHFQLETNRFLEVRQKVAVGGAGHNKICATTNFKRRMHEDDQITLLKRETYTESTYRGRCSKVGRRKGPMF